MTLYKKKHQHYKIYRNRCFFSVKRNAMFPSVKNTFPPIADNDREDFHFID